MNLSPFQEDLNRCANVRFSSSVPGADAHDGAAMDLPEMALELPVQRDGIGVFLGTGAPGGPCVAARFERLEPADDPLRRRGPSPGYICLKRCE
jgi:hypothetical protein